MLHVENEKRVASQKSSVALYRKKKAAEYPIDKSEFAKKHSGMLCFFKLREEISHSISLKKCAHNAQK